MTAMWIRKRRSRGFTLVEILVCLAVMAIAFVAVFRLQAQNLEIQREAGFISVAKYLAQGRLARIYAGGKMVPGTGSGDFSPDFPGLSYEEAREGLPDKENLYRIRIVVHPGDRRENLQYVLETTVFQSAD
jgi:prepilin-type N-terminal cleavage/methylation domain-containing protein